jgi:hypothetical protein
VFVAVGKNIIIINEGRCCVNYYTSNTLLSLDFLIQCKYAREFQYKTSIIIITTIQGVPKKPKTIEITIVKFEFNAAERNDA